MSDDKMRPTGLRLVGGTDAAKPAATPTPPAKRKPAKAATPGWTPELEEKARQIIYAQPLDGKTIKGWIDHINARLADPEYSRKDAADDERIGSRLLYGYGILLLNSHEALVLDVDVFGTVRNAKRLIKKLPELKFATAFLDDMPL